MFETKLQKLREKPEHHRKRIAFATSAGITALIVGVWLMTFSMRFSGILTPNVSSADEQAAAILNADPSQTDAANTTSTDQSPIQALQDGLSNGYSNFKNAVSTNPFTTNLSTSSASQTVSNGVTIVDQNPDSNSDSNVQVGD